jgi:hypothetical protein
MPTMRSVELGQQVLYTLIPAPVFYHGKNKEHEKYYMSFIKQEIYYGTLPTMLNDTCYL